jgi:hypothetical protein
MSDFILSPAFGILVLGLVCVTLGLIAFVY